MKVTNINGTSDHDCSCGSWLKHWENYNYLGQKRPLICPACGSPFVEVGAHVQKHASADEKWYIVPLCKGCNNKPRDSILDIGICALAPASKESTCGY